MINRTTKLRWRRRFRRQYRQVEDMGVQAEANLEKHFFKRLSNLFAVRRFVLSWLLLTSLLIAGSVVQLRALSQYYQKPQPAAGGTYTEGVVGIFTNANPIYATSTADTAASRLIFSGLMKYDQQNKLVPDLAQRVDADEKGSLYTITLRRNLRWHDGTPLTSADVLYTYQTIQNPDAQSPLFNGWKGIRVEAPNEYTVTFKLPGVLGSFPHSLVHGILPKHLLESVEPRQLRTARFNTVAPVGSGPFKLETLEVVGASQESREERIGLVPHDAYHGSVAKIQKFIIRTFRNEERMIDSYRNGELTSMAGLSAMPDVVSDGTDVYEYSVPLTGAVMAFFRTTQAPLNDVKVRQALVQAVDVPETTQRLGYPVILVKGPLLTSQLGFNSNLVQLPTNVAKANALLDEAGWKKGADGIRVKSGKPLTFRLFAQNTKDYTAITGSLQQAWQAIGVQLEVLLHDESDIQAIVSRHDYDALLYGISLGTDPDVFAYWHSSQASARSATRLNLSEYKSSVADEALEAGRTRTDSEVRRTKYRPFLDAWRKDAPALSLYQPRFLYIARREVHNFEPKLFNSAADRYANVENWMIRSEKVLK